MINLDLSTHSKILIFCWQQLTLQNPFIILLFKNTSCKFWQQIHFQTVQAFPLLAIFFVSQTGCHGQAFCSYVIGTVNACFNHVVYRHISSLFKAARSYNSCNVWDQHISKLINIQEQRVFSITFSLCLLLIDHLVTLVIRPLIYF